MGVLRTGRVLRCSDVINTPAASVLVFDQGLLGNKHMVIASMFSSRLLYRYHRITSM